MLPPLRQIRSLVLDVIEVELLGNLWVVSHQPSLAAVDLTVENDASLPHSSERRCGQRKARE